MKLSITLDPVADTRDSAQTAIDLIVRMFDLDRAVDEPPGVELDKDGLPHDPRIHAPSRIKNADGTWRAKRGVDARERAAVLAELKATMAATARVLGTDAERCRKVVEAYFPGVRPSPGEPPASDAYLEGISRRSEDPEPPPPGTGEPCPEGGDYAAQLAEDELPTNGTEAPTNGEPTPAEIFGTPEALTFAEFMTWLGGELGAGRVVQEHWQTAIAELGLPSLASIEHRPDLLQPARDRIAELSA